MAVLELVLGPDPVLKQTAAPVVEITDEIKKLAADMLETMYERRGVGMGANMVGALHRVAVVDLQEDGKRTPLILVNPEITWFSEEKRKHEEASLCFPGVSAEISRPDAIKVRYQDLEGISHEIDAEGWLATVLQHEIDYLDGKTYLDYLSKMKRDRLLKKMRKFVKGSNCCADPNCENNHS